MAALLTLPGCADGLPGAPAPAAPVVARAPADPIAAFAAGAAPGTEGSIVLASGVAARARLQRSYNAASGRECREVALSDRADPTLVCQDPEQGWVVTRPLLRGAARP